MTNAVSFMSSVDVDSIIEDVLMQAASKKWIPYNLLPVCNSMNHSVLLTTSKNVFSLVLTQLENSSFVHDN